MSCGCNNNKVIVPTLKQAVGAIGPLTNLILDRKTVTEEVKKERINICRECSFATRNNNERFAASKGLSTKSQCSKCTCFIVLKTKLEEERCPEGKW